MHYSYFERFLACISTISHFVLNQNQWPISDLCSASKTESNRLCQWIEEWEKIAQNFHWCSARCHSRVSRTSHFRGNSIVRLFRAQIRLEKCLKLDHRILLVIANFVRWLWPNCWFVEWNVGWMSHTVFRSLSPLGNGYPFFLLNVHATSDSWWVIWRCKLTMTITVFHVSLRRDPPPDVSSNFASF